MNRSSADAGPSFGIIYAHHSGLVADRVTCCDLRRLDMAISGVYLAWKGKRFFRKLWSAVKSED